MEQVIFYFVLSRSLQPNICTATIRILINRSGIGWNVVPYGFRNMLTWMHEEYKLPIYVTENGYGADESEGLEDTGRQNYYRGYINEMLKAIKIDGADVRGYTAWSLMDNYEWGRGYT